jgi:hypothetical protein
MTGERAWPERHTVRDVAAAKVLFDDRQWAAIGPFLQGPACVTDAATRASMRPNSMLAAVRRLVRLGLVEPYDSARRNGRRVQRYRAVARSFEIPLPLIEDVLTAPIRHWQELFRDTLTASLLEHHYDDGALAALILPTPAGYVQVHGTVGGELWEPGRNGPPVSFDWFVLELDDDAAARLQRELIEIQERYTGIRPVPGAETHRFLFSAHLAPVAAAVAARIPANAGPAAPAAQIR